jgi:hypothetical protein
MEALISVASGLVGTLVGAAIAWLAARKAHRLKTVFEMHREFHSPEMTRSRSLAGVTVRECSSESFDTIRRVLTPEETQHIWNVMYFYQRLWLGIKYKNAHEKYVGEMFGENFYWWYLKSYHDQLIPLDWQAARHIAALMAWIERHSSREQLEQWRERATSMEDPRRAGSPEQPSRQATADVDEPRRQFDEGEGHAGQDTAPNS